jgi:hypothetical protein
MLCKLNREPKILQYKQDPDIKEFIDHYKVEVGFSLHVGSAIEGAIGSEHKIDTTYISYDVALAQFLKRHSKNYNQEIVFTG